MFTWLCNYDHYLSLEPTHQKMKSFCWYSKSIEFPTLLHILKRTSVEQIRAIKTGNFEITYNEYCQMKTAFDNIKCYHLISFHCFNCIIMV